MKILDGKKVSGAIKEGLKKKIARMQKKPELAIIQIGSVFESSAYIARKKSFGADIGVKVHHFELEEKVKEKDVIELIEELNKQDSIGGIIVQMPIPKHINRFKIIEAIDPKKDVDGLTSRNAGLLYESAFGGNDPKDVPKGLIPATARGVLSLLDFYKIPLEGKRALVVGRSLLVGKPVAMLLLKRNATVTIAHSKTKNLKTIFGEHDVVIVAVGKAGLIKKDFVNAKQVIVDVGTNALKGSKTIEEIGKRKLVGDVDFEEVSKIVKAISPVPGGVGPMTVASIFENLVLTGSK